MSAVIRLSSGKLLVNLLQVVKRTINNTPLIIINKWRRRQTMGFLGRGFKSHIHHNKLFSDFAQVELDEYFPRYTQEVKRLGYTIVLIGPRPYTRPTCCPVVSGGGECYKA